MSNLPKITSLLFFCNSNKELSDEVDFLHADKHQNFLKVYFNTYFPIVLMRRMDALDGRIC